MPTLEWIGKDKVVNHHQEVPFRILDKKYTFNADKSDNMIIHGDNLLALKSLLPQYEGEVDCIYIDPPYNTGNEKWVYNDNVNDPRIKKWLGEIVGSEGEDLSRHDKWLCMMYPRLKLLHKLLSPTGIIFISIDDNELSNLKFICDEIFGKNNMVATICRQAIKGGSRAKNIKRVHDYVMVYTKDISAMNDFTGFEKEEISLELTDEQGFYTKGRELNKWGAGSRREDSPSMYFPIVGPNGEDVYPIRNDGSDGRWRWGKKKMLDAVASGNVIFEKRENGTYIVYEKVRGNKHNTTQFTTWFENDYINAKGSETLKRIFNTMMANFDYSKPFELIKDLIFMINKPNAVVLDSFAGSGTTAHAVLEMNKQDGGNRKFILVEMMDYAENITAERVKRVIKGYGQGNKSVEGTSGDFSYYELGAHLFKEDGNLNEKVPEEEARKYIYYMETKKTVEVINEDNKYMLGKNNETAYYFYYKRHETTTLNHEFLSTIKTKASGYVIYADKCALSKEIMAKYNVVFKKIPRDITRI